MRSDEPITDVAGFMLSAACVGTLTHEHTDTHILSHHNTLVHHFIDISLRFNLFVMW